MFKKFIQRPVLAIVISVVIVFTGLLAIKQLPISQFPDIAPTTVNIFIAYPGSAHFPADPVNQNDVNQRWVAWLKKYLN